MIERDKKDETRCGYPVRIDKICDDPNKSGCFVVYGSYYQYDKWFSARWTLNGETQLNNLDYYLIEIFNLSEYELVYDKVSDLAKINGFKSLLREILNSNQYVMLLELSNNIMKKDSKPILNILEEYESDGKFSPNISLD
jgi:hypothetical protein